MAKSVRSLSSLWSSTKRMISLWAEGQLPYRSSYCSFVTSLTGAPPSPGSSSFHSDMFDSMEEETPPKADCSRRAIIAEKSGPPYFCMARMVMSVVSESRSSPSTPFV